MGFKTHNCGYNFYLREKVKDNTYSNFSMHIEPRSENKFPSTCIHLHSLTEWNLMGIFKRLMF